MQDTDAVADWVTDAGTSVTVQAYPNSLHSLLALHRCANENTPLTYTPSEHACLLSQRSMSPIPPPRQLPKLAGERDHRRGARDRPRKRSLSPDSLDNGRPPRRRRSSPSSGDEHYARNHEKGDKLLSRTRSTSREGRRHANGNRSRHARDGSPANQRRTARYRSTSRSRSREVPRRRRRSHSQSMDTSPPPRRRRSFSRSRSRTPPRRHRQADDERYTRRRREGEDERPIRRKRSYSRSRSRSPPIRSKKPLPSQLDSFRGDANGEVGPPAEKEKEKINWKTTGLLAAETNTVQVSTSEKIVLKYNEPPDARKPPASARWRLFIFKGPDTLGNVQLSTQSCWLVGREAAVADLLIEHPSSSKQHAVIQFRYVVKQEKDKEMGVDDFLAELGEGPASGGPVKDKGKVRPYLLDLESTNGTYLNGDKIGDSRYVEVREKDVIKFGLSEREYVVLKE